MRMQVNIKCIPFNAFAAAKGIYCQNSIRVEIMIMFDVNDNSFICNGSFADTLQLLEALGVWRDWAT